MSLLALRDAIKARIETQVPEFHRVYTHGGRFDVNELRRWGTAAPSAVVAPLGISGSEFQEFMPRVGLQWGVFVIAKDTGSKSRHDQAIELIEKVMNVIVRVENWGDDKAHEPTDIRGSNLYDGNLDATGIAIWAVTWSQVYDLDLNP